MTVVDGKFKGIISYVFIGFCALAVVVLYPSWAVEDGAWDLAAEDPARGVVELLGGEAAVELQMLDDIGV